MHVVVFPILCLSIAMIPLALVHETFDRHRPCLVFLVNGGVSGAFGQSDRQTQILTIQVVDVGSALRQAFPTQPTQPPRTTSHTVMAQPLSREDFF
jgi:hypothetical protein